MKPKDDVRAHASSDGLMLMNVSSGEILSANQTGAKVWTLLETGRSVEDIIQEIARAFDAPVETVEQDVKRFVESLRSHDLVA